MAALGLSYDSLAARNPGLVYVSITPFGQTGPYRDYQGGDIVAQAVGALMHTVGLPDREPLKIGGSVVSYAVGVPRSRARCWPCTPGLHGRGSVRGRVGDGGRHRCPDTRLHPPPVRAHPGEKGERLVRASTAG